MGRLLSGHRAFVYGGNATFTLVNASRGTRLTFHVVAAPLREGSLREGTPREGTPREGTPEAHFVRVLTGPDNTKDYAFLGTVFGASTGRARYVHSRKSQISPDASSAKTAEWLVSRLDNGGLPATVEFWHEGRCCVCGRKLTTPESVAAGIGPTCAGK
jgi:hypothetical protein